MLDKAHTMLRAESAQDEKWLWEYTFGIEWQTVDPAKLEPRRWIYGKHYLDGAVSATIADGGIGKSTLALTEAIAIVTGRPLLGLTPTVEFWQGKPVRRSVLYYNAEESLNEIKRRVCAICQHFDIDLKDLHDDHGNGLTVISGHDYPLVIGTAGRDGITFSGDIGDLENYVGDVIILDPVVSIHQCPENDNSAIDAIVKRLGKIAATPCVKAIELVHHTRKPAQGGHVDATVADGRGASAFIDGVRSARVLNRMTEAEALRARVDNCRDYFRVDHSKTNYTATGAASQWYKHVSVLLPNGDDVGVIVPWHMPGAFDGVSAHMQQVRELARGGTYRADPRSPDWIGRAVADVLNVDVDADGDVKRIKTILKSWYGSGALKKIERKDEARHVRIYVEAGEFVEQ
jgi:hypothetical protein